MISAVPVEEWNIQLEGSNKRYIALMGERSIEELVGSFTTDVASDVEAGNVNPRFQTASMKTTYKRFEAVVRLSEDTL